MIDEIFNDILKCIAAEIIIIHKQKKYYYRFQCHHSRRLNGWLSINLN